ncbi:MAG: AAA family ATPase [Chloroflexi bacterium]|nr:AAA family ATPase [Chloroflexota bacterium]
MPASLTGRERDILSLLVQGLTNGEIADHLVLSTNTVKWYVRQLLNKLGVENRRQIVARAKALNLLGTPVDVSIRSHNLPAPTTQFFGRSDEIAQLRRLLDDKSNRLITLIAAGGMGKTRLALATAESCLAAFSDGVYFMPLSALRTPDQLLPLIADTIGLQITADQRTSQQQLAHFLRDRHLLLILDNFEHLLNGVELLIDLLEAAPHLRLLLTSRERLNVRCETLFAVGGLSYPKTVGDDGVLDYSAVQLFLECARRQNPRMSVQDLASVVHICQMTQGMPLAVELAAAWVGLLSPAEVAAEIGRGIDFLQTNLRDVPERQRSIIAVFRSILEASQ